MPPHPASLVIGSEYTDGNRGVTQDVVIQSIPDKGFVALAEDSQVATESLHNIEHAPEIEYKQESKSFDFMTRIYVASITVVGLFIAYRVLVKRK